MLKRKYKTPHGRSPNYKGGTKTGHGYRLVYVGKDHHLSDCRGYAYEHRLEAEKKIGRKLRKGEQVHHKDEDKTNNAHDNLIVARSFADHKFLHRKKQLNRRKPRQKNPTTTCACGCGTSFKKFDSLGRPRIFVQGHNMRIL